jgi:uncharacterized protein YraI
MVRVREAGAVSGAVQPREKAMRHPPLLALFAFLLAVAVPGLAAAAPGYTTAHVKLRAGPSTACPAVVTLPYGAPVQIVGCVSGWSWCDTIWNGYRGWVAGAYLNAAWQGRQVPFVAYAPRVAVPVVAYSPTVYANRYYVGRPAYRHLYVGPKHSCYRGPFVTACN